MVRVAGAARLGHRLPADTAEIVQRDRRSRLWRPNARSCRGTPSRRGRDLGSRNGSANFHGACARSSGLDRALRGQETLLATRACKSSCRTSPRSCLIRWRSRWTSAAAVSAQTLRRTKLLKKLRHSVEFLSPCHSKKEVKRFLRPMKELLKTLSALNDAATAIRLSEELAEQRAELTLAVAALAKNQDTTSAAARERLRKEWVAVLAMKSKGLAEARRSIGTLLWAMRSHGQGSLGSRSPSARIRDRVPDRGVARRRGQRCPVWARVGQMTMAGNPTAGSSLKAAMVSSIM